MCSPYLCKVDGKYPTHAHEGISRNGGTALLIHNPDTEQRSAVSFKPWQLYETLVFTKQEAGWQPLPAWIP